MFAWLVLPFGVPGHLHLVSQVGHAKSLDQSANLSDLLDIVVVSDDTARYISGCDAVSLVDLKSGKARLFGDTHVSPGYLSATGNLDFIASLCTNNCWPKPWIYILRQIESDPDSMETLKIFDPRTRLSSQWLPGGPSAVARQDTELLLSTVRGVEKYAIQDITRTSTGPIIGEWIGGQLGAIVLSRDSDTAYLIGINHFDGQSDEFTQETFVYILNVRSMTELRKPIRYASNHRLPEYRIRRTFASLSPDERYLIINAGNQAALNVIDLHSGTSTQVSLHGVHESYGVKFNYAHANHGKLVVHGRTRVAVYEWQEMNSPRLLVSTPIPAAEFAHHPDEIHLRFGAIAWSGRGDAVVTSVVAGLREWRVLRFENEMETSLEMMLDFDSCTSDQRALEKWTTHPHDILTLNDRIPPPSPTPSSTPAPTSSGTPTASPWPTSTSTATPSRSPSPRPSATSSPTPTPLPAPLFLPLLLRERCTPEQQRVDVVLVVDASTSMRQASAAGRPKIDAAREAARSFLGLLKMRAGDQAGLVAFNRSAERIAPLGADLASLEAALDGITLAEQTCIACGIAAGAAELEGPGRRPGNLPVLILLTDGRSNPGPVSEAVDRADQAKRAGITVFTIGLGEDVETEALRAMASRPDHAYLAPDAEDLIDIYRRIAVALPCPASTFWAGR